MRIGGHHLVAGLCPATHCPAGSACPAPNWCSLDGRNVEAEPPRQCVPGLEPRNEPQARSSEPTERLAYVGPPLRRRNSTSELTATRSGTMAVDMSRLQRSVLDDAIRKARALQQRGSHEEAAAAWDKAANDAESFAANATTDAERKRRRATADDLRAMAVRLRADSRQTASSNVTPEVSTGDEFREAATRLIHRSSIRFQDIAGLEQTRSEIQSAFALSLAKAPEGVHVQKMQSLLFYGPAGCGKTLLAAAVSNGLDATVQPIADFWSVC